MIKLQTKNGVTLIALVITIIVLLILAGVTISMVLGNNGILTQAKNAVDKYNQKAQEEQDEMNSIDWDKYIKGTTPGGIGEDEESLAVGTPAPENQTLQKAAANYKNPTIPKGFKAVDTADASWTDSSGIITDWNNGLVIEDGDGNQFVWVPVDGTDVPYAKWNGSKTNVNEADTEDDTLPIGIIDESSQITDYGGFYIGRYEAGLPSDLGGTALTMAAVTERNKSGYAPIVKQNEIPWNYINYSYARTNAERMTIEYEYDSNSVVSGLVTGTMWDATMKWLSSVANVETNSKDWGNYKDAPVTGITLYSTDSGANWLSHTTGDTKGTTTSWLLKTGHSDYTKRKNIYDLAGNVSEWSNDRFISYPPLYAVERGGAAWDIGVSYPAMWRAYGQIGTGFSPGIGFRVALFLLTR